MSNLKRVQQFWFIRHDSFDGGSDIYKYFTGTDESGAVIWSTDFSKAKTMNSKASAKINLDFVRIACQSDAYGVSLAKVTVKR